MAGKMNDSEFISESNRHILADHYGFTPEFIRKNKAELDATNKLVRQTLHAQNETDPRKVRFQLQQLQQITERTYTAQQADDGLNYVQGTDASSMSGFKMIYGENDNREDIQLFNFASSLFATYRNLVSEYRNIARLIPEIHRCADMKSRDILAINEITKKSVQNVYKKQDSDTSQKGLTNSYDQSQDPINIEINENILEKYQIEDKLPRYIMTALIEGAKPVVIYPYKDIVDMAKWNLRIYKDRFGDFHNVSKENYEQEALNFLHKENNSILKPIKFAGYHVKGMEDTDETRSTDSLLDDAIKDFVSEEEFKEYCAMGLEDIKDTISNLEQRELMDISTGQAINKIEEIENTRSKFRNLVANVKIDGDLTRTFKEQIYNAAKAIDQNIDFYDQSEVPMADAINNFRRLASFTAYHDDPKTGIIAYDFNVQDKYKPQNPETDQDPLSKFNKNTGPKSVLDEFPDQFSKNTKDLLSDCLIKEYDSEDVIPVIISGKHVGYYAIEVAPYTGNLESVNKRNCNFTDLFINLGFNNDNALSPNPSTSGTFAGVNNIPMGGTGAASDVPTLGITGAGSMAMAGGLDVSGFTLGDLAGDDAKRRNNIMKKILFNIIKKKLKNNDLEEDTNFVDTMMNLIRDGAIIQNKVKIMYIPEKYMCYFTPGLDGNGIPQSFMKDTLFTCYEKILVNMNNIMTRLTRTSTKDKITLNIGKAKNMGHSIRSIENALTTRRLNVESPFTSLSRVLKASSLSETIIVPVYNDEKLFDYEDISMKNEVPSNDDLEEKLTNNIVTSLKCPITIMNPYQEEDFASIAASRNAEYRFDIIRMQKIFSVPATKMIRLLFVGSGLYGQLKQGTPELNLKDVEVVFNPPESLNMKNANEEYGNVSAYIDNVISVSIDPDDDTELAKVTRWILRQNMYMELFPSLNIDKYLKMANDIKRMMSPKELINRKISRSVNDYIQDSEWKATKVTPEGKVIVQPNNGIGNADSNGVSTDDNFSGDDSGDMGGGFEW